MNLHLKGDGREEKRMWRSPWQQPERTGFTILIISPRQLSCLWSTSAAAYPMCSALLFIQTWLTLQLPHTRFLFHLPFKKQQEKNHCESKISSWSSSLLDEEALRTRWYTRFGMLRTAMGIWGEHKGELLDQKLSPWSHLTLPYAQPCRSSRNGKIQTPSAFRTLPQKCLQWADISHSFFTAVPEVNCYVAFVITEDINLK